MTDQPLSATEVETLRAALHDREAMGEPMHDVTISGALLVRILATLAAASPPPLAECGFNEPHEPHEYVVARNGKPLDLPCPGLAASPPPLDDHEGEPHEFRTVCRRCGKDGMLHVSLITRDETVTIAKTEKPREVPDPRYNPASPHYGGEEW